MSKLAVHIEHYKAGAVGAIDRHNKRLGDSHSNELIDPARSGDNMAILRPDRDLYEVVREVADHASGRVTKNSVLVTEWVVYPPEELQDPATADPHKLKEWSEDTVDWMRSKGLNPVSATLHRDETTNHLHVDTVPLTADGRLSRKELYTRDKLREYHTELAEHLQSRGWDIQRGESTKGKQVKSKNVREYKKEQEAKLRELEQQVKDLTAERDTLQAELDSVKKVTTNIRVIEEEHAPIKTSWGGRKVTYKAEDAQYLKDAAVYSCIAESEKLDYQRYYENEKNRHEITKGALTRERDKTAKLKDENAEVKQENELMADFIKSNGAWERFKAWRLQRLQERAEEKAKKQSKTRSYTR